MSDEPKKYEYGKTIARLRDVERLILEGITTLTIRQTLSRMWNWPDLSERHARRYYKLAKDRLKQRFEKDTETDYQWCKENYMRLFREAYQEDDKEEQRKILKEFRQMSGLDEHVITHKLDISEDQLKDFDQLFS